MSEEVLDVINDILRWPTSKMPIHLDDLKDNDYVCQESGDTLRVRDGILDFRTPNDDIWGPPIDHREVDRFLTADEIVFMKKNHNVEQYLSVISSGVKALFEQAETRKINMVLDVGTPFESLFRSDTMQYFYGKYIIFTNSARPCIYRVKKKVERMTFEGEFIYIVCNEKNIPVKDNAVGLVTSAAAHQHIVNPEELIPEVSRIIQPDGHLFEVSSFFEENSRSERFADIVNLGHLITEERFKAAYMAVAKNVDILELARIQSRFYTDILPIGDDTTIVATSHVEF